MNKILTKPDSIEIGIIQTIRSLMEQYKISVKELSEKMNVHRNTVSNILNGKTNITIELLQELSPIFNVPVGYFFKDTQEVFEDFNSEALRYSNKIRSLRMDIAILLHFQQNILKDYYKYLLTISDSEKEKFKQTELSNRILEIENFPDTFDKHLKSDNS